MPGKLSELTPIGAITNSSVFEVLHLGQTEAVQADTILAYVSANLPSGGGGGLDEAAVDAKLASSTTTKTVVTGTVIGQSSDMNVQPTGNSSATYFARRDQLTWNTNNNLNVGGWITANESVLNIGGTGTIDKVVSNMSQVNLSNSVTVSAALGYEAVLSAISATTTVTSFCGFYFPNLRNVANINRVTTLAAFANDDSVAICRTKGPFYNGTLQEFAPPHHPGITSGRYYTSPYWYLGEGFTQVGSAGLIMVYIPHRITIGAFGFNVTNAPANAKARLAMYTTETGRIQNLVWQSGEIDCSSTGIKEVTTNVQVDAGTYWLGIATNMTIGVSYHAPMITEEKASVFGLPSPLVNQTTLSRSAVVPFPYGVFPALVSAAPTYNTGDSEPHIWFRL